MRSTLPGCSTRLARFGRRCSTGGQTTQSSGFAAGHDVDPLNVPTAVLVGTPSSQIVDYSREHTADAIVLGSHGHGVMGRFVLGSVSERVMRQAGCPVMIVPHRPRRVTSLETETVCGAGA